MAQTLWNRLRMAMSVLMGAQDFPPALPSGASPIYLPLPDDGGELGGAIVLHHGNSLAELLAQHENVIAEDLDEDAQSLGHAVAAIPAISTFVRSGNLVQIVGKPQIISGLSNGSYKLIRDGSTFLGTVKSAETGRIAGQLRFEKLSRLRVAGPLLLWQAANIIVGTIHLQRIDQKLKNIKEALIHLDKRLHYNKLARAIVAEEMLEEIAEKYRTIGYFTDDMVHRLVISEKEIRTAYKESELLLDDFAKSAEDIMNKRGKAGAKDANDLLENRAESVYRDATIMTDLFGAQYKAHIPRFFPRGLG
jgi:hypothetical protein